MLARRAVAFWTLFVWPTFLFAGVNKWSPTGPFGGYSFELEFHRQKANIIFASGLLRTYRSTDAGATWAPMSVPSAAVIRSHPSIADLVYAASDRSLYRSTDSGSHWSFLSDPGNSLGSDDIPDLEMNPTNASTLYTFRREANDRLQFEKSTDGGLTWVSKNRGLTGRKLLGQIEAHPGNPRILYQLCSQGVLKSVDEGESWVLIRKIHVEEDQKLEIDSSHPEILYLFGTNYHPSHRSTDSGRTWKSLGIAETIAIDPQNSFHFLITDSYEVLETFSGGVTFQEFYNPDGANNLAVFLNPANTMNIYVNQDGPGLVASSNSGQSWKPANSGLNEIEMTQLALSSSSKTLFGIYRNTLWAKLLPGGRWAPRHFFKRASIMRVHPKRSSVVVVGDGNGIQLSEDSGRTWTFRSLGGYPHSIAMAPSNPHVIYAGTTKYDLNDNVFYGLMKTTDFGSNWRHIGDPSVLRGHLTIAVHPLNPGTVLLANRTNEIHRTTDGGMSWQRTTRPSSFGEATSIVYNALDPMLVYAAQSFCLSGETCYSLSKSTDGGLSWSPLATEGDFQFITADPMDSSVIYAGGDGLFVSADAGSSWSLFDTKNLPRVTDLQLDSTHRRTLFAGSESGVHVYSKSNVEGNAEINQILPNPAFPGDSIRILGRNFGTARGRVRVGRIPVTSIQRWSSTEIEARLPTDSRTAPVVVEGKGTSNAPELVVLPKEDFIYPTNGPSSGGTRVALVLTRDRDFRFALAQGRVNVRFGRGSATTLSSFYTVFTPDLPGKMVVLCTTPPGRGTVEVTVTFYNKSLSLGRFTFE